MFPLPCLYAHFDVLHQKQVMEMPSKKNLFFFEGGGGGGGGGDGGHLLRKQWLCIYCVLSAYSKAQVFYYTLQLL